MIKCVPNKGISMQIVRTSRQISFETESPLRRIFGTIDEINLANITKLIIVALIIGPFI